MSHPRRSREIWPQRAAGGVVWRPGPAGDREIVLVHRPRFDDWSLPKGKRKRGEHPLAAACREVSEETGVRPSVGPRLPTVSYSVWAGDALVDKVVDYWAMSVAADGGFTAGAEVDALAWLPVDQALDRLSYAHDLRVVTTFGELPPLRAPIVLVRHAPAGEPGSWPGPDTERPLDPSGLARAKELADLLTCFTPARLISASPRRCVQTLEILAAVVDVPIEVDPVFDESADPGSATKRLRTLAIELKSLAGSGATVVCSQGGLIPPAMAGLTGSSPASYRTPKGTGWVLTFTDDAVLAAVDELA